MKVVKSWLLKLLGQERYLKVVSTAFFVSFSQGWLRNNPSYFTHYLVGQFIKPGHTIIDIGANLGYYTVLFANRTGPTGKVFSVEPIELYRNVLKKNTHEMPQVTIFPFALGEKEGTLKMGNPSEDKHRHGLMRILKDGETGSAQYEVAVKNPEELFASIEKIDYIKCDIEGYEVPVIPAMKALIAKHRPIMQIETEGENKKILMGLLNDLKYKMFYAGQYKLVPYYNLDEPLPGDLIAIPEEKKMS